MTGVDLTFRTWEMRLVESHFGDMFEWSKHPFVKSVGNGMAGVHTIEIGIGIPMQNWFWQAFPPPERNV